MLLATEARRLGYPPRGDSEAFARSNQLVEMVRGIYRLAKEPSLESPDLAVVAKWIPDARLCLISALSFQMLTTEIPHEVYIALVATSS